MFIVRVVVRPVSFMSYVCVGFYQALSCCYLLIENLELPSHTNVFFSPK